MTPLPTDLMVHVPVPVLEVPVNYNRKSEINNSNKVMIKYELQVVSKAISVPSNSSQQ